MPTLGLEWGELVSAWEKVRDSGQWTEGYYVKALEDAIAQRYNLHAVAVNSAGTGLYAMLRMAEECFDSSGSVAVQDNTFYATGAMVRQAGRQIALVDCGTQDFSMVQDALTCLRGVGVVILTHVGGGVAKDYHGIGAHCRERNIVFFEDAAHALGAADPQGVMAGQRSDGAVFSLYPTKAVPVGEGGVIVTRHAAFADRLREFRNYGKWKDSDGTLRYRAAGFNFRMDEWTAAIGYLQLKRLNEIIAKRADAARRLAQVIRPVLCWGGTSNWYKYAVSRVEADARHFTRRTGQVYARTDQLHAALGLKIKPEAFPGCQWIAANHVCLPLDEDMYAGMSVREIETYLRGAP